MTIKHRLAALEKSAISGPRTPETWIQDDDNPALFHLCGGSLVLTQGEIEARRATLSWVIHPGVKIRRGGILAVTNMRFDEM